MPWKQLWALLLMREAARTMQLGEIISCRGLIRCMLQVRYDRAYVSRVVRIARRRCDGYRTNAETRLRT